MHTKPYHSVTPYNLGIIDSRLMMFCNILSNTMQETRNASYDVLDDDDVTADKTNDSDAHEF